LRIIKRAAKFFGGIFDYDTKSERLVEVSRELEDPKIWDNPQRAQSLGKEKVQLENIVETLDSLSGGLATCAELLEMAEAEQDEGMVEEVKTELNDLGQKLDKLEFQRMVFR